MNPACVIDADARRLLDRHPEIETIDLLLPDCNGVLRGKQATRAAIEAVYGEGVRLPGSVFAADIGGNTVESTGLGFANGDQDFVCRPIPGTLRLIPWAHKPEAQLLLQMENPDGSAFEVNPRVVLQRVDARLRARGLFATIAIELEFYLLDRKLNGKGMPQIPVNPNSGARDNSTQVYGMDDIDAFHGFIDAVEQICVAQGLPATSAVAEYAPGQFEINLQHCDDALRACDDAVFLRRAVKAIARSQGYTGSFMAKPFAQLAGSGMHVHVSLYDANGVNQFATHPQLLQHAIGGLQHSMHEAMLLFAPHANSYRRFQPDSFVPLSPSWGFNNRTVALRIPNSEPHAMRIEHRVPGADANPYLAAAVILAGIADGIERELPADAPIVGNAYEQTRASHPLEWCQALDLFRASRRLPAWLGARFHAAYCAIKQAELDAFRRQVTPLEVQWYLRMV